MFGVRVIIFGLISSLVQVNLQVGASVLGSDNECAIVSLLGSVSDIATACSGALAVTQTHVTTTTVYNALSMVVVTATSYTATDTSTSILSAPTKKRRDISIEDNTFNVDATVNVVVLDIFTPSTTATYILPSQTPISSNSLINPSASNDIYTTVAPQFLAELVDNNAVTMESEVGTISGAVYTHLAISAHYNMSLDNFCTCLASGKNVTTTVTSTVTIRNMTAATTTTTASAIATYDCFNMASEPFFSSLDPWTITSSNDEANITALDNCTSIDGYSTCLILSGINTTFTISQTISTFVVGKPYKALIAYASTSPDDSISFGFFGKNESLVMTEEGLIFTITVNATSPTTLVEATVTLNNESYNKVLLGYIMVGGSECS